MSTIALTFSTQALDFSPLTRGQVDVVFNDGNQDLTLSLILRQGVSTSGYFEEVAWVDGMSGEDDAQAAKYAQAWNRDYQFVGSEPNGSKFQAANLQATVSGNEVTITASKGTFTSWQYTGNVINVGATITNSPQVVDEAITAAATATGDCNTIDYNVSAVGDELPADLRLGTTTLVSSWNGSQTTISLDRGIPQTLNLFKNGSTLVNEVVIVPRKFSASEFTVTLTKYLTSADVVVSGPSIGGTTPYEYAITATSEVTGSGYQSSNTFQGVLAGQYKIWIKDKFGCEDSKIIDVTVAGSESELESEPWFLIPDGQSIPFAAATTFNKDTKPNFFNTGSYNENVLTVYRTGQEFDVSDENIGFQFQSSYSNHLVQLVGNDNSVVELTPVLIQDNLNIQEKVDCTLFPIEGQETSKTGVWFNGGDKYQPGTTTVIEGSPYDGTTPRWAKVGQIVELDGLGTFTIESTGFDNSRGGYFVISLVTATDTPGIVQVTYNRHPYNLYEVYFSPSLLTGFSFITIDKGFDGSQWVEPTHVSEPILGITDTIDHLLIKWSDSKNRGDIVFSSGINYWFRRVGEFYGEFTNNESQVYTADSQSYSIEQKTYLDFTITLEMLSSKQVNMLNIASTLEGFNVNGLNLIRKDAPEITRYGKSNLHTWKCTFVFGANQVAVKDDEVVLSVNDNTIVGEGPFSGKTGSVSLYKNNSGKLVLNNSANLVKQ